MFVDALTWCRDEYGMRRHSRTLRLPREAFEADEKSLLRPAPTALYANPKVGPDQHAEVAKACEQNGRSSLEGMVRAGVALLGLLMSGCGSNYAGRWAGSLDENSVCGDGSSGTTSSVVTWNIDYGGRDELTIFATGGVPNCLSTFFADQKGERATFRGKTCPSTTNADNTIRFTEIIKSTGSMTNTGEEIRVRLETFTELEYLVTRRTSSCNNTAAGVLRLEK